MRYAENTPPATLSRGFVLISRVVLQKVCLKLQTHPISNEVEHAKGFQQRYRTLEPWLTRAVVTIILILCYHTISEIHVLSLTLR